MRIISTFLLLCALSTTVYSQSTTFSTPGGPYSYTVPAGVTSLNISMAGAQGGPGSGGNGGFGGSVAAMLAVTPGQVLNVYVGGLGSSFSAGGTGGVNGGGASNNVSGGGGGGESDIRVGGTAFPANVVLCAGAGGGGGYTGCNPTNGGAGGGANGAFGQYCGAQNIWTGNGGTQTGSAACGYCGDAPGGTQPNGGTGGAIESAGGSGGAGWWGGSGACYGGGGGGSSYIGGTAVSGASTTSGTQSGNGFVTICAQVSGSVSGNTPLCVGQTITLVPTVAGGSWISANNSIATVGTSGIVSGVASGTVDITYSTTSSCGSGFVVVPVTVNANPGVTGGQTSACAGTGFSYTNTPAGGTWTSGNTSVATIGSSSGIVSALTPGTALITYTSATGCSTSQTLTVNSQPATNAGASVALCTGGSTPLTASGATTYSWSPAAGLSATTGASVTATPSVTTTYTVTGTGAAVNTGTIVYNQAFTQFVASSSQCNAWTNFRASLPNSLHYTGFTIRGSKNTTGISCTDPVVAAAVANALYTATPYTGTSDGQTWQVNITGCTGSVCGGAYVELTNQGSCSCASGYAVRPTITNSNWGGINGATCGAQSQSIEVDFYYTYTCSTTSTVTVSVNPYPAAISGPSTGCAGSILTYTDATAGGTWSSSLPAVAAIGTTSGVAPASAPGTTNICYTNSFGCSVCSPLTVNPLPALFIAGGGGSYCSGSPSTLTITLSGSQAGVTYQLLLGGSSSGLPSLAGTGGPLNFGVQSAAGTYTVSATNDATGCNRLMVASPTISINPTPAVFSVSGGGAYCAGDISSAPHVMLSGSQTGVNYRLFNGISVVTVIPGSGSSIDFGPQATGGTYTIVAENAVTGCQSNMTSSATVVVNPLPSGIGGHARVCEGATAYLYNVTGTWSTGSAGHATVGSSSGVVTGVSAGNETITFTLPVTGCFVTITETIDPLPATIAGTAAVCVGLTSTLSDAGGGTWTSASPAVVSIGSSSGIITGMTAGTSAITYTLPTGCMTTMVATANPLPGAITGTRQVCEGSVTTLADAGGGTWWSGGTGVASVGSLSGDVSGIMAGTELITYMLPTGCMTTATITVNPLPSPISGAGSICAGGNTTLTDVGGTWSSGAPGIATVGSSSGVVNGISAGNTAITYTLPTGCLVSRSFTVNPLPGISSGTLQVCEGSSTILTNAGGGLWSSAGVYTSVGSTSGSVSGTSSGTEAVTYTLPTGCKTTSMVTVNPLPAVITGYGIMCVGQSTTLTSSAGGLWSSGNVAVATSGSVSGDIMGVSAGTAGITYMLPTGCLRSSTVTVNPLPVIHTLTGGGSYCDGRAGVGIVLDGSEPGISYRVFVATGNIDPLPGTGFALHFDGLTIGGSYTILATDTLTYCAILMSGSPTITVIPVVVPSVSVTAFPGTSNCIGTAVTLNAAMANGGSAPLLEWLVNGVAHSASGTSLTYVPANSDVVTARLTSNAVCAIPAVATHSVTMTVNPLLIPVVSVTSHHGSKVIIGQPDTFVVAASNAGTASYLWRVNSTYISGATNTTFISTTLNSGDVVECIVTSHGTCGGYTSSASVTVDYSKVFVTTSAEQSAIEVIPNPSSGIFRVIGTLKGAANADVTLELSDVAGRAVFSRSVQVNGLLLNEELRVTDVTPGVYLLKVRTGQEQQVFRIVISK